MFVTSGIKRDKGHYDVINLDHVATWGISPVPNFATYKKYSGDRALILYYPNLEDQEAIFIGSLKECIAEQNNMISSMTAGEPVCHMKYAELLV